MSERSGTGCGVGLLNALFDYCLIHYFLFDIIIVMAYYMQEMDLLVSASSLTPGTTLSMGFFVVMFL